VGLDEEYREMVSRGFMPRGAALIGRHQAEREPRNSGPADAVKAARSERERATSRARLRMAAGLPPSRNLFINVLSENSGLRPFNSHQNSFRLRRNSEL
jgi:hypothetical protein